MYIRPPNSESPNVFEKHHLSTRKANEITLKSHYIITTRGMREKSQELEITFMGGWGTMGAAGIMIQNWQTLFCWLAAKRRLLGKQGENAIVLLVVGHR